MPAYIDVREFGARGDVRFAHDGQCNGDSLVRSQQATFSTDDAGRVLNLYHDEQSRAVFRGATIIECVDAHTVRVDRNGNGTVQTGTGVLTWGSDDTSRIQQALDRAGAMVGSPLNFSENTPAGGGNMVVSLSGIYGQQSAYVVSDTLRIPRGVVLDGPAMLVSGVADTYTPLIRVEPGGHIRHLKALVNMGQGLKLGEAGERSQTRLADVELWRVGTAASAAGQRQIGFHFEGLGFSMHRIWCKGGNRGVLLSGVGDVICHSAFLIGCIRGLAIAGSSQITWQHVLWDTNESACLSINASQNVLVKGRAFINNLNPRATQPYVALLGDSPGTQPNANIDLDIAAQNTGGKLLSIAHTQDLRARLTGSNGYLTTGNTTPISGGLVYGTNIGSTVSIEMQLPETSASIPHVVSGTRVGALRVYDTAGEHIYHTVIQH